MTPERRPVYLYDGTLEGFLCCVYESYARKEIPCEITSENGQTLLAEDASWIITDWDHAQKVYVSLDRKITMEAQDFIRKAFLIDDPDREMLMYRFIRMGYQYGRRVMDMLTDDTVGRLIRAVRGLEREAHSYMGFVRFTVYDQVMVSCIRPKNRVLPLLAPHFEDRFPEESFLIYDRTYRMAAVHKPEGTVLTSLDKLVLPPIEDSERAYHELWRCFQRTIAIESRTNPRCQMNHMPKRYWEELTEMP